MIRRLALVVLALAAGGISAAPGPSIQSLPPIKTVFVIPLENHDFTQACPDCAPQQILGNPAAPYLNSLITPGNSNAAQVSYATAYYSAAPGLHPSEPNYIWSEAGTSFGSYTDNDPGTNWGNLFCSTNHLCGQLNAAGIAWKDYQEDLEFSPAANISSAGILPSGSNIYNGSTEFYYAVKHNPMEFFTDTQNQNVYPLGQLWTDLASNAMGRYNWITPDEFNEMHSALPNGFLYNGVQYTGNQAAIAEGDNCLAAIIPQIMASAAFQDHGVIIIWTDETESTDDTNTTLTEIIISPMAKGNAYASRVPMSHFSDLKTMDEIFGLPFQNQATAAANDLSDMLLPRCGPVIAWSFTNLTLAAVGGAPISMMDVTGTNYIQAYEACGGSGLTITQTPAAGTPLNGGTWNQVVITATDNAGNTASSTNLIVVAEVAAPVITLQPASVTNAIGATAFFQIGAMPGPQLLYQWFFGTNMLKGQTNSTLTISAVGPTNAGYYHAVVVSGDTSTSSAPALLAVLPQPVSFVGRQMRPGADGFHLTFSGPAGQAYQVLASADLTVPRSAWTVVGSGTFGSTNAVFTDASATNNSSRFYLIQSP